MTEEIPSYHSLIAAMLRSVVVMTTMLCGIAAVSVAAYSYLQTQNTGERWWFLPASILFGGFLGLVNFRWLAFAVERKCLKTAGVSCEKQHPAMMLLNGFKLVAVFIVLFIVIKWQLAHIFGFVAGLSLCFLAIIWEGLTFIKNNRS